MVCVDGLLSCWVTWVALGVAIAYFVKWYITCPMKGSENKKQLDGKIVVITG